MGSAHFKNGSQKKFAIVLSCPGKHEEENPPGPAKGHTGINLDKILNLLIKKDDKLASYTRENATITNAWDRVEYIAKTNRTEATLKEVLNNKNLDRLASDLSEVTDIIIACGKNAKVAVNVLCYANKLHPGVKTIDIGHLSTRAINKQITIDIDGKEIISYKNSSVRPESRTLKKIESDNMDKRLQVLANNICDKILECDSMMDS